VPLIERNALDVARQLGAIAAVKFPDPKSIWHNGYVVISDACLTRLKAAASSRYRPPLPWSEIRQAALTIPNTADRVLVLATVGERMYPSNPELAKTCIREAGRLIGMIPNIVDRAERLYTVANAYHRIDEDEAAKQLLRDAMGMIKEMRWDRKRRQITDEIVQLAHIVDPDFAAGLTPLIDNPAMEHESRVALLARDYHRDPKRVQQTGEEDTENRAEALSMAAMLMLESLNSNVGQLRHPRDVGDWLVQSVDSEFDQFYQVGAWAVQNTLLQTKQSEILTGLFRGTLDCVALCSQVGRILFGMRADSLPMAKVGAPSDLRIFKAGTRKVAVASVREWLRSQLNEYAKIYDPYFSASDLEFIREIRSDFRVYVLTSWKAQTGVTPGDRGVERLYREAWRAVSDQAPPWTQVTIVGTRSGDSPIHNRYVL